MNSVVIIPIEVYTGNNFMNLLKPFHLLTINTSQAEGRQAAK
jgi:hypothetical protein